MSCQGYRNTVLCDIVLFLQTTFLTYVEMYMLCGRRAKKVKGRYMDYKEDFTREKESEKKGGIMNSWKSSIYQSR